MNTLSFRKYITPYITIYIVEFDELYLFLENNKIICVIEKFVYCNYTIDEILFILNIGILEKNIDDKKYVCVKNEYHTKELSQIKLSYFCFSDKIDSVEYSFDYNEYNIRKIPKLPNKYLDCISYEHFNDTIIYQRDDTLCVNILNKNYVIKNLEKDIDVLLRKINILTLKNLLKDGKLDNYKILGKYYKVSYKLINSSLIFYFEEQETNISLTCKKANNLKKFDVNSAAAKYLGDLEKREIIFRPKDDNILSSLVKKII